MFSDQKRFNLDGAYGLKYYWHDLHKEKENYFNLHSGEGSVMVWGFMGNAGITSLAIIKKTMNAKMYFPLFED